MLVKFCNTVSGDSVGYVTAELPQLLKTDFHLKSHKQLNRCNSTEWLKGLILGNSKSVGIGWNRKSKYFF